MATTAPPPLRRALSLLDAPSLALCGAVAALLLTERLLVARTALALGSEGARQALWSALLVGVFAVVRTLARLPLTSRVRRRLHLDAGRALLARHLDEPSARTTAEIERVVFDGLEWLEWLLSFQLPVLVADAFATCVVAVIVAAAASPSLLALGTLAIVAASLLVLLLRGTATRAGERSWEAWTQVAHGLRDGASGGAELVAWGAATPYLSSLQARVDAWARVALRSDLVGNLSGRLPTFVGALAVGMLIVHQQTTRGIALEQALGEAMLLGSVLPPLASLAQNTLDLARSAARMRALLALLGHDRNPPSRGAPPARVDLRAVTYRYAGADVDALTAVDLRLQPGDPVLVVGANGTGKSTLLALVAGLKRPTAGVIALDGDEHRSLLGACCYLSQTPHFAAGATVFDALSAFAPASAEQMCNALHRVGVLAALERRAQSAPLEVRVEDLSAGQRQRVAIARCLLDERAPLLLDEPEASLDPAGVTMLRDLLAEEAARRIVLAVVHAPELQGPWARALRLGQRSADEPLEQ